MHQLASCQIDERRVGRAAKVDGRRVSLRRANDHSHAGVWNVDGLQYGLLLLTAGRTSKRYAKPMNAQMGRCLSMTSSVRNSSLVAIDAERMRAGAVKSLHGLLNLC